MAIRDPRVACALQHGHDDVVRGKSRKQDKVLRRGHEMPDLDQLLSQSVSFGEPARRAFPGHKATYSRHVINPPAAVSDHLLGSRIDNGRV